MQPSQNQPEEWRQPTPTAPAAPYQPVAEASEPQAPVVAPSTAVALGPEPVTVPEVVPVAPEVAAEPLQEGLPVGDAAEPSYDDQSADDAALLRWQSTEYLQRTRDAKWYGIFALVAIVAVVLAVVVLKSITFAILIPVMVLGLVVYVRREPELLQYTLSRKGLHVNDKLYAYELFKSFGILSHAGVHTAVLIPRKRFQISQTVYFPEEIGEQLVDMLAARLPMKEVQPDAIDRLLEKLHL